jgi:hypothetical protein
MKTKNEPAPNLGPTFLNALLDHRLLRETANVINSAGQQTRTTTYPQGQQSKASPQPQPRQSRPF